MIPCLDLLGKNVLWTGDSSDKIRKTDFEKRYGKYCDDNEIK